MAISMLKIRRPLGRLIFNMGIAIPGKTVFLIETAPRAPAATVLSTHPCVSRCLWVNIQMSNDTDIEHKVWQVIELNYTNDTIY